ncbi:MAG: hypothetical protein OXG49_01280 [Chloroflexi bacterium]|nr:hypothetical protein [Chloroflexota bacterium]
MLIIVYLSFFVNLPRGRRHLALADALVSLSMEFGYDCVSIRELTERADVG